MTAAEITLGKAATIASHSSLCLLILLVSFSGTYGLVPWEDIGVAVDLGPAFILFGWCVCMPVVALSASLLALVTLGSRSLKEAQTAMSLMVLVPFAPALLEAFDLAPGLLPWLPIAGQEHAMMEFAKGGSVGFPELLVSTIATLAIASIALWGACQVLRSERVLFGR